VTAPLVTVRLLGLPLERDRRAVEHMSALNREFTLIRTVNADEGSVPVQLHLLAEELRGRFRGFTGAAEAELAAALARNDSSINVVYEVPPEVGDASRRLAQLLDAADAYCRAAEYLITLAAPPDTIAYRRWFLGEFIDQVDGAPPTPWAQSAFAAETGERVGGSGSVATVLTSDQSTASATVRLAGEIDLDQAPELREVLSQLLLSGVRDVVLDGGEVTFIDSVGVSVLMAVLARCQSDGGSVTIVNPSDRLVATLESIQIAALLLR
jgi:anti-sigma B factor antagonist